MDEDRLMLDRSPDEMGSHCNDMDELCDSGSDMGDDETETTVDGERIIYPWMKKIHVAGVGKLKQMFDFSTLPKLYFDARRKLVKVEVEWVTEIFRNLYFHLTKKRWSCKSQLRGLHHIVGISIGGQTIYCVEMRVCLKKSGQI